MKPAVFFDIDGTLVDTTYLHALAWWRAFRDFGEPVAFWKCHRIVGMGSDQLIERLIGRHEEEVSEIHDRYFKELHPEVAPFPGAAELLYETRARGGMAVLVSSAKDKDLKVLLNAIDAEDAIDSVVTSADVDESKPSPDLFVEALQRTGVDPERVVAVGDTVWDAEAAGKAGLRCIGLLCGGNSASELTNAGMLEVHKDPKALLEDRGSALWALLAS